MSDLEAFKNDFKGDVVTPTDSDYAAAIARWAINAERRAKIVAFVKDEQDIALAIKYARATKLPIAIRGGGHNPSGASSSEGGLVIDLSRYINTVRVDPEKKLGYVGGGALWETVDKEAIKYGLASVAGTVNHTGVGGLILGGGYGWLSCSYGLVIDNLVQATVVTASGEVLTANSSEHPDLFFGLRGGGSNFGVVTEFVLKLHPQRATVWSGALIFAPTALEKLVETTNEWLSRTNENEAMLQLITVSPEGRPVIIVWPFYNGSEAEGREKFKSFIDIGPVVDETKEIPYETLNSVQNPGVPHGYGMYMKGVSHKGPHVGYTQQCLDIVTQTHASTSLRPAVVFEYFPLQQINAVARDETAFRRDPTSNVLVIVQWDGQSVAAPDFDEAKRDETVTHARRIAHQIANIITSHQQRETADFHGLGYGNYDTEPLNNSSDGVKDKAQLIFAENYPRLQKIKKRYDPDNIFNKWFPITPA